jgi:hypothetical protein
LQIGTRTKTNRQVQHVEAHVEHLTNRKKNRQHAEVHVEHLTSRNVTI